MEVPSREGSANSGSGGKSDRSADASEAWPRASLSPFRMKFSPENPMVTWVHKGWTVARDGAFILSLVCMEGCRPDT
ncbi:MAG: hypothetical protein PVF83_10580 [Anaerolineales bacterium]